MQGTQRNRWIVERQEFLPSERRPRVPCVIPALTGNRRQGVIHELVATYLQEVLVEVRAELRPQSQSSRHWDARPRWCWSSSGQRSVASTARTASTFSHWLAIRVSLPRGRGRRSPPPRLTARFADVISRTHKAIGSFCFDFSGAG